MEELYISILVYAALIVYKELLSQYASHYSNLKIKIKMVKMRSAQLIKTFPES